MEKGKGFEENLNKYLESLPNKNNEDSSKINVENKDSSRFDELEYFSFDSKMFPCGLFYPSGTIMKIRPAKVSEIQAYSMVDDGNYYDIVEKMNDMLLSCVRIKYPDGRVTSYLDLRDPDRFFTIYIIRELTFQKGNSLVTKTTCSCGTELQIELKRENFKLYEIDKTIKGYYNAGLNCFTFETISDKVYNLAPPTIGLQKSFTEYIVKMNSEKKKINMSFLKIIPFLLHDRTSMTIEGIQSKLNDFENPSLTPNIDFQFLNSVVSKMTFGIKGVMSLCACGLEVHADDIFPNGASSVFVIHDAFEKFIKK